MAITLCCSRGTTSRITTSHLAYPISFSRYHYIVFLPHYPARPVSHYALAAPLNTTAFALAILPPAYLRAFAAGAPAIPTYSWTTIRLLCTACVWGMPAYHHRGHR